MAQSVLFATRGAPQPSPSSPQAAPHTNPSQCIPVHPSACWQPEQLLLRVSAFTFTRGFAAAGDVPPVWPLLLCLGYT